MRQGTNANKNAPLRAPKDEALAVPATSSSAAAVPTLNAAPPPHSDTQASAAQPDPPTERQRCIDNHAMASQPGSTSSCSSCAAPPAAPSASEPLQRSFLDYGARRVRIATWLVFST